MCVLVVRAPLVMDCDAGELRYYGEIVYGLTTAPGDGARAGSAGLWGPSGATAATPTPGLRSCRSGRPWTSNGPSADGAQERAGGRCGVG